MYPVSANFHTLAIADSPKTRCRIYFISDAVNCWDDADVQSNGTLLVGAVGDTDSNGRIGQGGVTINEIFNKDQNISIGGTVSYQIGMTLVNSDGALNNFAFGRCKVYLDVYDDANSTWLPCPLGVYRIELPVKRKVQLISCTGYDQMQVLNAIADTWWNGLDFTGGLTIANILNSMVTQLGLHLSATSSTNMVNTTLSFTTPPIDSVERTYRDILGWIAEATGTVAHFNRDGELDMRQYLTPQIGGNNIVIDTDTTGNQCLSIDVAEYSVSQIDALTIKLTTADQGVTVGSGTNVYTIMDNPFLYGPDVATIQGKLTPIYNRLSAYATYSPISTRLIYDWSIEAGDIIYILNNSATYNMPIFQQKMTWRGGYVTSELISSGDTVRPQVSSGERETYRYNVEMATKVGDNEIISKINQTAEQIQIQASKVNLTGYITATNLATAGQTVINGGNITTGTITVGGENNQNGTIRILDSSGNEAGSITNNQFYTHRTNGGVVEGASLSSGTLQLTTDGTQSVIITRDAQGGGWISLDDADGASRVRLYAQNGSLELHYANGDASISASDGIIALYDENSNNLGLSLSPSHIIMMNIDEDLDFRISNGATPEKKDIELFYVDTYLHKAVELGKTDTAAHLRLYSPDNQHNITLDTLNGSTLENTTINGVLDVTQRRCYATLSSAGWYRVCKFDFATFGEAIGAAGGILRFAITDSYASYPNDAHTIDLLLAHNKVTFVNEASAANGYIEIDKIRYTFTGTSPYNGYVDIHYLGRGGTTYVGVSFDYTGIALVRQATVVAQSLQSVAASPSGETVLTEYTFAANTNGDITSQITFNNANIVTARRNGNIINISYQGNNIAHSDGEVIATFPDGLLPSSTHWCIGSISGVPTVLRIRPVGIDIWYAPSYPSGRLYFEATYVL